MFTREKIHSEQTLKSAFGSDTAAQWWTSHSTSTTESGAFRHFKTYPRTCHNVLLYDFEGYSNIGRMYGATKTKRLRALVLQQKPSFSIVLNSS